MTCKQSNKMFSSKLQGNFISKLIFSFYYNVNKF